MMQDEVDAPGKSAAERVVKICLAVSIALGAMVIVLKLIRGDNVFDAVSGVLEVVSVTAATYWMIVYQRRSVKKTGGGGS